MILQARWLLTNIRAGSTSNLDVQRKAEELKRLEDFFLDVGCEAVALGASDLSCRRLLMELEHISTALSLRTWAEANGMDETQGSELVTSYYRAPKPEIEIPGYMTVDLETVRNQRPFHVYHADESLPALWAASPSAKTELPDLDA